MLEFLDKLDRMQRKIDRWLPPPAIAAKSSTKQRVAPTLEEFLDFAGKCYIRSGTRLVRFDPLFDYQVAIAQLAEAYPGFVIVKDRQLGITELIISWMLARARNPAYAGAVFSITEKDAHKVSARVKRMPSQMPDFAWEIDSVGVRKVADGGEMNFRPSTANATRGLESIWDLFFDEAGFIPIASEMYAASSPSQEMVGEDARTFIVSTIPPDGTACWFWEQLESATPAGLNVEELLAIARSGGHMNKTKADLPHIPGFVAYEDDAGWCKLIIGHKAHPVYGADPDYVEKQRTKKKLTVEQANREHNLTLPTNAGSLFSSEGISKCAIAQWQPKQPGRHYLLCVDPNFGAIGEDFYELQVWDITKIPVALVYEFRDNSHGSEYHRAQTLNAIDAYKPAMVVFEGNSGGKPMAERIQSDRPRIKVETVNTGRLSKIHNTDRIALMVEQGECTFPPDWIGIQEMKKFSKTQREALSGHDDAVMCWAVGMAMIDEARGAIVDHSWILDR